jgi:hypothetical protein
MRPSLAIAALSAMLVSALGGCGLLKGEQEVPARISARIVGMPAGEFFDRYGAARTRVEGPGGTIDYTWESSVGYARPGVLGLDPRVCRLRLAGDARGRIARVDVLFDPPGLKTTSRCAEIFAGP